MHKIIKSNRSQDSGTYTIPLQKLAVVSDEDTTLHEEGQEGTEGTMDSPDDPLKMKKKILAEARQQAGNMLQEAQVEAEKLKKEAMLLGREEGRQEHEQLLQVAQDIMATVTQARGEIIRSAEPQVVELAIKMARSLLKTSVLLEPDLIKDIAAEAISLLAGEDSIVVKVNPQDLNSCRTQKDFFKEFLAEEANLRFLPSEDVAKGCCIVQGQFALVESCLEERFKILEKLLLEETKNAAQGNRS